MYFYTQVRPMGATIPCLCLQFHLWFSHTWYSKTGLLVPAGSRFGLKWQMGEWVLESIRFNYEKETQLLYLGLHKLSLFLTYDINQTCDLNKKHTFN